VNKAASAIQIQLWSKEGFLCTLHTETELSRKITWFILSASHEAETCHSPVAAIQVGQRAAAPNAGSI